VATGQVPTFRVGHSCARVRSHRRLHPTRHRGAWLTAGEAVAVGQDRTFGDLGNGTGEEGNGGKLLGDEDARHAFGNCHQALHRLAMLQDVEQPGAARTRRDLELACLDPVGGAEQTREQAIGGAIAGDEAAAVELRAQTGQRGALSDRNRCRLG
jgi:hypothetical protein